MPNYALTNLPRMFQQCFLQIKYGCLMPTQASESPLKCLCGSILALTATPINGLTILFMTIFFLNLGVTDQFIYESVN
jgi:hypothetical protein